MKCKQHVTNVTTRLQNGSTTIIFVFFFNFFTCGPMQAFCFPLRGEAVRLESNLLVKLSAKSGCISQSWQVILKILLKKYFSQRRNDYVPLINYTCKFNLVN